MSDEQLNNLNETGSIVGKVTEPLARDLSVNPLTNMPLNISKLISTRNLGVHPTAYNLWAMVRFTYDSNLNSKQKACIKAALLDLQSKTNVRFIILQDNHNMTMSIILIILMLISFTKR